MAAGGKANTSVPSIGLSLTENPPDMAGVGGNRDRDMVLKGKGRRTLFKRRKEKKNERKRFNKGTTVVLPTFLLNM